MRRILFVFALLCLSITASAQHKLQIDDGAGRYGIIESNPLWPIGTTIFTMPPTGGTLIVAPPPGVPALVWLTDVTGNTLTGGSSTTTNERFGSFNNYDVIMMANNTEQMRMRASGGINIPTTNASGVGVIYQNGVRFIHSYGTYNIFAGRNAGNLTTTGDRITASGVEALNSNTSGSGNTANGYRALYVNQDGDYNTANGESALLSNINGSGNTASGASALRRNTSGSSNTANGLNALNNNTVGNSNTASGFFALVNTNADGNTGVGSGAGSTNTIGTNNTLIGYLSNVSANDLTNATALGATAVVNASNKIQLGNASVTRVSTHGSLSVRNIDYVWPVADGAGVLMSNGALALSWNNTPTLGGLTLNGNLDMNQNDIIDLGDVVFSQATSNISNSAGSVIISDALQVNNAIDAQGGISNGPLGGSGLVINDDVLHQGITHLNGATNANNQNAIRFKELSANGLEHVSFRAPAALAADVSYTLPLDGGTAGQVLSTSGGAAATLSWVTGEGWGLAGNALTGGTPATPNEWLGSSNNYDVIFRSNNTERMRIASGGNIGIGSTSPFTQLTMPGQVPSGSVGSVATNAGPTGIAVSGRYAYVTTQSGSLQVIDISNPASMVVEGTLAGLGGTPRQMNASGRYAYVANEGSDVLQIIDVANPTAPVLAGSIAVSNCNSVHVVGRYAYVTSYTAAGALRIIDVSNPSAPVQLSSIATGNNSTYVYVSGKYAFVTAEMAGNLECYDISNPTAPTFVSSVGGMNRPYSVNVSDKYAYVAGWQGDFYVVDVSNPATMAITGTNAAMGAAYYVHSSGRYVYVVETGGALRVMDVSNPASPTSLGTSTTGNFPFAVYSAGRYVYVCNRNSNTVTAHDMGGAYVQSLETGNLEAARIQVRNDINVNGDIAAKGGIVAGTAEFHGGVGIASGGFKVASGGTVTVAANVATINAAAYSAVRITSDNDGVNDVITINGGVEGQTLYIYYNHTAGNDDIVLAGTTVTVGNNQPAGITMCYIAGAWRVVGTFLP